MVDKNTIFGGMLTTFGAAKKTNCDALGIPWEPRYMLIGDANGTDPIPDPSQTKLINQVYRAQLNQLYVSPTDDKVLVAELVLPPDIGGWWVRELALEDKDGVFSAVSNVAPSYKPQLAQNSGRNQVVRMHIITSSTANIQLKIDPSVVLATREYVDTKIMEELYKLDSKQSVLVATTANIALAGLQVIDGVSVSAGARVLVKNQTVAKDNGIYIAAAPAWARAPDADTNAEVTSALLVSVEQGATLADSRWQLVTDGVIVLGATALTFQDVTQGYAPINSPTLISPTANTPTQFDNSQLLITSAFAKRMGLQYSGFFSLNVSTALTVAEVGGLVSFSAASMLTCTMPATTGIPSTAAAIISLVCAGTGGLTISPAAGGDTINTSTGVVGSILLGFGDTAEFIRLGGQWRLIGGTIASKYAAIMSGPNWITPPQFDVSKTWATTEFVQRALGNIGNMGIYNVTGSLTAADFGKIVLANAGLPITLTLPPIGGGVLTGSTIHIRNVGSAPLTVVPPAGGSMSVIATIPITSIVVNTGSTLEVTVQGSNYFLAGSAALKVTTEFASSLGTNGYQKLPSGKIEQWGMITVPPSSSAVVTFPIAFPNNVLALFAGNGLSAYIPASTPFVAMTPSGTPLVSANVQNGYSSSANNIHWFAIGR